MRYTSAEQSTLLRAALRSIESGLNTVESAPRPANSHSKRLAEKRASFVTLSQDDKLRGCIGSIEPTISLIESVEKHAFSAAFRDPRFPPLRQSELDSISIQVSILGSMKPVENSSEAELITQLRPGIDGCMLREGSAKGIFLPSVWVSIPDPEEFLKHLKIKAGLPADYWSDRVEAWRYTTESVAALASEIEE